MLTKNWVLCQAGAIDVHDAWHVDGRTLLARVGKRTDVEPMRGCGQWLEVATRTAGEAAVRDGRHRRCAGVRAAYATCLRRGIAAGSGLWRGRRGVCPGLDGGLRQRERDSRAWPNSDIGRERRFVQTLGLRRPGERAVTAPARRWRRIVESEDRVTLLRRNI